MQLLYMHPVFIPRNLKLCHFCLPTPYTQSEWAWPNPNPAHLCLLRQSAPLFLSCAFNPSPISLFSLLLHLDSWILELGHMGPWLKSTSAKWNTHFNNTLHHQYSTMVLCKQTCCGFYRRFDGRTHSAVVIFLVWAAGKPSCHCMESENNVKILTETHKSAVKMSSC